MDLSQYLEIFLDETKEHLQNLNTQILALEEDSGNMDTINEIFRAAHSLKGMAGTMGYKRMQALTHDMENVFSEVRSGNIKVKPHMVDTLFQCLDALEEYTDNIQNSGDEGTNENEVLIRKLNDILKGIDPESEDAPTATETQKGEGEAQPESAAQSADASSNSGWKKLVFDESQLAVMREAMKQGKKIYGLDVKIQETCVLRAARAFLVFKAIEEKGEIIVSQPSAQDIEDEKFERDFSIVVISSESLDDLLAAARWVSEIESVLGGEIQSKDLPELTPAEKQEEAKEAAVQADEKIHQIEKHTTGAAAPGKAAEKKQAANKPIVNRTVRVDIEKLDVLMNLVSELIIAKNSLISVSNREQNSGNGSGVNEQIEYLESVTTNLHESVMKVRMVPIESVVNKFPRMIRDLSKSLNKKMELYMTGEETELDRTVVDEIGDPLMHLLRNAADHGLESAELRAQRGKPAVGSIFLDAYQDGNNVVIEVRDDGNGIDTEDVKATAIERGIIAQDQAGNMSQKEVIDLLFLPSFSTSKKVTDVSGRGVGLDVVKSKIEALSGEIEVKTKLGEGSTWIIRLPLTLAIIQALMVIVGDEKYAISLGSIQTIEDIAPKEIKLVQNKEVIHLRGTVVPLIRLSEVLDIEDNSDPEANMIVVIIKKGDKQAGLVVNQLMGQQEIVIKSLGKYIRQCKYISGATILGDGEVALILDVNALI
jgi:two-component system chemotaxis sensor kinase CheA